MMGCPGLCAVSSSSVVRKVVGDPRLATLRRRRRRGREGGLLLLCLPPPGRSQSRDGSGAESEVSARWLYISPLQVCDLQSAAAEYKVTTLTQQTTRGDTHLQAHSFTCQLYFSKVVLNLHTENTIQ